MSNGPLAIIVELVGHVLQFMASAELGLPGVGIHGEVLELLQVNHQLTVFTANACSRNIRSRSSK